MAGVRRGAWTLYRVLIALFALACVVQIFLAGRGVFGIRGSTKLDDQSSLDPHRALGSTLGLVAIVLLILVLIIWDKRLVAWTLLLAVLATAVQMATAVPKHPWIAGLHPVFGVAILGIAASLAHSAWRPSRAAPAAPDG
jgi:hypothetical protein